MKKITTIISLVLATTLMLTGCAGSSKSSTSESSKGGAASAKDYNLKNVSFPLKDKVSLNLITHSPSFAPQDPNDKTLAKKLEEKTNVHINWTNYTDEQFPDKKNLALSTSDLPDGIFDAGMTTNDLLRFAKQGVIIPVEDLINNDMPNLKKILDKKPDYRKMITAPDGHIYSFPWIEELGTGKEAIQSLADIPYINKKWLDELGIPMPTTTDELEAALVAFKEKAPEGRTDIIPMSFIPITTPTYPGGNEDPGVLLGAFGLGDNSDHYLVTNDKKVVYSATQDGYKKGIQWLHKLQGEGLIDPEAFTQDWSKFSSKGQAGRYGLFFTWDKANVSGPSDDYVPLPPLKGSDGKVNVPRSNGFGVDVGRMVVTSSNKNLELTAKWVDEMYAPLQSIQNNWGTYGDEGDNIFELTSDNKLKHLPLGNVSPWELRVKQDLSGPLAVLDEYYGTYTTKPDDAAARLDTLKKVYVPAMTAEYNYPLAFMDSDSSEQTIQLEAAIKPYIERKKAEWILNGGIENEWDSYLQEVDKLGLSKLMELKQTAFDKYYSKN